MRLTRLHDDYAVARLGPATSLPEGFFRSSGLVSATRTDEELSLVAPVAALNDCETVEIGWTAFKVAGPLDFSLTGILADLSGVLARAEISLFAVSTYDTDYILIKTADANAAIRAWSEVGHKID